jgi:hypothetical protein
LRSSIQQHLYPTSTFEESYNSNTPEVFAAVVASTFALVAIVFFVYDMFVQRRNQQLIERAAHSNAIVSSMFPGNIRDQLIGPHAPTSSDKKKGHSLKTFMASSHDGTNGGGSVDKPLADLFLETTILFADISGT